MIFSDFLVVFQWLERQWEVSIEQWNGLDHLLIAKVGIFVLFGNWVMIHRGTCFITIDHHNQYYLHSLFFLRESFDSNEAFFPPFSWRFIEWKDCCCSACFNVKVEKDESQKPFCRDGRFQHSIRSKACEALSHFPFVISLYAGYSILNLQICLVQFGKFKI